jgi:oligopeptide transport system substrate-binding protein
MASGKAWNRRIALAGGAALAAGAATLALQRTPGGVHHTLPDARTFRRGNAAEPQTLDPLLATGVQDDAIIGDLMTGLMVEDPLARPVPSMAERWTTSADGLSWTFYLRESQWSDGVPLTADDFIFAWRRILDPATASGYAYYIYLFKNAAAINAGKLAGSALGARALDAHTLEVHLENPAPYLLEMLSHTATMPLPRHVVEIHGKDWTRPGTYVGNGAFVLKEWIPNEHVLVEKNPRFYDAANVALDRIYYYPTDDYGAGLQRLRVGELDTQDKLPGQQIDWIKANLPQTIDLKPQLTTEYIVANVTRAPFNDVRVRAALNLALNREAICDRIARVGYPPAYALVPPGVANYPGDVALDFRDMPFGQRIEKARSLMRAAGFGENLRLKTTFMIRSTAPGTYRAIAAAIQQMYAQVFIDIAILPTDFPVFLAQTQSHDFDLAEAAWGADFNDAETFLELLQTGGGNNLGAYSNPAYDAKLAAAQNDLDLVSRGQALAAAERLALNDYALVPMFFFTAPDMVWPYVKGWKTNPLDKHRARWISIDQAAREKQFA